MSVILLEIGPQLALLGYGRLILVGSSIFQHDRFCNENKMVFNDGATMESRGHDLPQLM